MCLKATHTGSPNSPFLPAKDTVILSLLKACAWPLPVLIMEINEAHWEIGREQIVSRVAFNVWPTFTLSLWALTLSFAADKGARHDTVTVVYCSVSCVMRCLFLGGLCTVWSSASRLSRWAIFVSTWLEWPAPTQGTSPMTRVVQTNGGKMINWNLTNFNSNFNSLPITLN